MTNIINRSLLIVSILITGILFPLNNLPAQDAPPAPEATESASDIYFFFLPILANNPMDRVITPTPEPSSTPVGPTVTPSSTPGGPTPTPGGPTPTPGEPTPTLPPVGNSIIVDHTSLALFDQIPAQYLEAARNLRMIFSDRSVGANIHDGLSCLAASSWAAAPASCRRDYLNPNTTEWTTYNATDLANGIVPELIQYPASSAYNRSNWEFEFRQGTWSSLTDHFINDLGPRFINSKDVLSYQFSYLNFNENVSIMDPTSGFFVATDRYFDIADLEAYIAQHPDKTFFLWTSSLARSVGTLESTQFNDELRRYAIQHEKILFDAADILSHDRNGQPCYDNNNDGANYPAVCVDYTTELDGGHLGSVSGGKIMMAKAFWVLMAQIAGWNP